MMKTTFLKTVLFAVFAILFGNVNVWSETTYFNFSGTTGYLAPPATDWTSLGIVTGGSYLKIATGAVISPAYNASNSLVFKYDIASYGSGVAGSKTILYILDANDNSVISQYTLTTANDKTYIKDQIQNIGSVSKNFKIKIEGLGDGTSATSANKATRLQNYSLTGTEASTCTASNLAFAQSTYNKLASDAAFTQTATSLNGTTPIKYSSSNTGVATVNETTGEVSIVGAGSTDIIASQIAGTHNSVAYCSASATYAINVTTAAPTITVTEVTVPDMVAYAGETDAETINISGINLSGNIGLSITGTNANLFTLSTNSVAQTSGTAANTVVTVYYSPTSTGTHTATLNVTSAGATSITRTLNGSATWAPLAKPVLTGATNVSANALTLNWNAVNGATEYEVNVNSLTIGGGSTSETESFDGITPNGNLIGTASYLNGWSASSQGTSRQIYVTTGNYGVASPSFAFTTTGDFIQTKTYLSPITSISFWAKQQAGATSSTLIQGYNGTTWTTIATLSNADVATAGTVSYNLTTLGFTDIVRIKLTFTKGVGNLGLDDIIITTGSGTSITPLNGSPFTVNTNSKELTGLNTVTTYYYTVKAKNANVTSESSNELAVATLGTEIPNIMESIKLHVLNGNIIFNATANETLEIFNALGQKFISIKTVEGINSVPVSIKGMVMVKIGNQTAKVIL